MDEQGQHAARVGGDLESIKADLNRLRADIASLTQDLVSVGRASTGEARERLGEELRARVDQLNAAFRDTAERARGWWQSARHSAEDHPLPTLGLAFGVGLLVGLMLHHRK